MAQKQNVRVSANIMYVMLYIGLGECANLARLLGFWFDTNEHIKLFH